MGRLHAVVFEIKSKTLQMYGTQRSEVRLPVHIITGSGTALLCYVKNTVPQPPLSLGVSVSQVKNSICL